MLETRKEDRFFVNNLLTDLWENKHDFSGVNSLSMECFQQNAHLFLELFMVNKPKILWLMTHTSVDQLKTNT